MKKNQKKVIKAWAVVWTKENCFEGVSGEIICADRNEDVFAIYPRKKDAEKEILEHTIKALGEKHFDFEVVPVEIKLLK